jgi:hypothetical protein
MTRVSEIEPSASNQSIPPKRNKKDFSLKSFFERRVNQTSHFIKSFDLYGQPITLHYQGEDTFKTCPGGFISMIILLIILLYAVLKGKQMIKREEWSLIQ